MVRVRLRQWAGAVTGLQGEHSGLHRIHRIALALSGAESPVWARHPARRARQRAIALDLIASAVRFNRRWTQFLDEAQISITSTGSSISTTATTSWKRSVRSAHPDSPPASTSRRPRSAAHPSWKTIPC